MMELHAPRRAPRYDEQMREKVTDSRHPLGQRKRRVRHDRDMSLGYQQKRLRPQRRVTGESGAIHRLALSLAP